MSRLLLAGLLVLCLALPVALAQDHDGHADDPHTASDPHDASSMTADSHGDDHGAAMEHGGDHGDASAGEDAGHGAGGHHGSNLGAELPLWSALPFAGILLSIALFPLFAPVFWHHHYPKISAFWALLFAVPFLIAYKGDAWYEIMHIYLADYIPFIILLLGLFTASGGILLKGSLVGTPRVNLLLLLIGTILASWMGTTGAAMVLIRPVLRANKHRKYKVHTVVFFIFLVANIGGSLTPLGDPPLFLGFLHGVPFFWTLHIFPHFAVAALLLLLIYYIFDSVLYKREAEHLRHVDLGQKVPLSLHGWHNLFFLLGIMGAVLFSGTADLGHINIGGVHMAWAAVVRDVTILVMVALSLITTPYISKKQQRELGTSNPEKLEANVRHGNEFDWFPIKEVAYLFAGIFMCIIPALAMLKAGTAGSLAFIVEATRDPIQFFWITGSLSSFLDNAPTYLTFFNLAEGRLGIDDAMVNAMLTGELQHAAKETFVPILKAISAGAVFFGAMTYIGNAPNFMVRSIAEEQKVKMPSFFGYMLWSIAILVPLFLVISVIFFL